MPFRSRHRAPGYAAVLSRVRRLAGTGPAVANLVVVGVLALVATLLLVRIWADSWGVSSDLRGTIAPQLSSAGFDPAADAQLDSTARSTQDFAAGLLPIGAALGRAADATTGAARDAAAIRDHTRSTARALAKLDTSATAIRTLAEDFAPVAIAIVVGVGDIHAHLGGAEGQARGTARALDGVLGSLDTIGSDARSLRTRTAAIEAVLGRIERDARRIAAAEALDCPARVQSCLP